MTDQTPRRFFSRRRRANVKGGRQFAHKVRVSAEEEGELLRLAHEAGVTVPRLLVEAALAQPQGETATERRETLQHLFKMHRLLANIANNVNQIAWKTNATGELQKETFATLDAVRRSAARIDDAIDRLTL